jgi:hypothetical protein
LIEYGPYLNDKAGILFPEQYIKQQIEIKQDMFMKEKYPHHISVHVYLYAKLKLPEFQPFPTWTHV